MFAVGGLALASAGPGASSPRGDPRGTAYLDVPPIGVVVAQRLAPQVDALLDRVIRDRRDATVAGIRVFSAGDKFLPGKLASAMARRILVLSADDERLPRRLAEFSIIADMTVEDRDDSWGTSNYLKALHRLKDRGLLERAVRPQTLARLRTKLDWRPLVRSDLGLAAGLPSNYYGVAFHIARLRFLLGWDSESGSRALLGRALQQYRRYSGKYGFADETEGEGRYDRYSVLLVAEIAERMMDTGLTPPAEVRRWLRASVDAVLPRLNLRGEGWEYGRSIGVYGDTAILQVLTAAARLKVLTPTEERMAYAFCSRVVVRYMDFWVDPATGAVDMWGRGRRTDRYRGQNRVLGESLSLAGQLFEADEAWSELGYGGREPDPAFVPWLRSLPRVTTTWFARGRYDRVLITIRDDGRIVSLPLVNGARVQHVRNPYFPIPFSPGMLQASADGFYPQLLPRITLADGSVLLPLSWFEKVRVDTRGASTVVTYRQSAVDHARTVAPVVDRRVSVETSYRFSPGRIERSDLIKPSAGVRIAGVEMVFATASGQPRLNDDRNVTFASGDVTDFATAGYGKCLAEAPASPVFQSPTGPFATTVKCSEANVPLGTIKLFWALSYLPQGS
jgi:hypothetical protein